MGDGEGQGDQARIFALCGVKESYRKTYSVVVTSTLEQRRAWLDDVGETVNRYFPEE